MATNFPSLNATGQIVPDTTLPIHSIVTPNGSTFIIEGGTEAGGNLFHSFDEFSVPTNSTAFFNNAAAIQNIFSRVTGSSISNIDGILQANGTANLFLINPNGIIFGPNAQLNLGDSFFATTADSLQFADGFEFSATDPQTLPLLTINIPTGLQFGEVPGEIKVQGLGHNLTVDDVERVINSDRPNGLRVQPGSTLALVGGDIALEGGNLTARGGRIELGSIAVSGTVPVAIQLLPTANGFMLNYEGVSTYGDIQFINAASADVSENGGEIQVQGRQISLRDGSAILAITGDTPQGGILTVRASESLESIGHTPIVDNSPLFRSSLISQAQGSGKAGDLVIETGQLIINGGQAAASTFSTGDAGNLTVIARDSVELMGVETDGKVTSGLFSLVNPDATGNGGSLTLETQRLIVRGGAQISASTFGIGAGGNIEIRASEFLDIAGGTGAIDPLTDLPYPSALLSQAQGVGDSGQLMVETGRLIVGEGAEVSTKTFGAGNAGSLSIQAADSVEVIGNIFTSVEVEETLGRGGDLTIETRRLLARDGGQISASTFGTGAGGTLTVRGLRESEAAASSEAESVELMGVSPDGFPSGLFAITGGTGAGGNAIVYTERLIVRDGAQIAASTLGSGAGGTVTVNASESVELRGVGRLPEGEVSSGLFARSRFDDPENPDNATFSTGDAGSINVTTGKLIVQDGATVTVSSSLGSEDAAAGTLAINADRIRLDNGTLTAESNFGDFGNISLRSRSIQLGVDLAKLSSGATSSPNPCPASITNTT